MRLQLGWRRWFSAVIVGNWLAEGRHYELGFLPGDHSNVDQRIAEDVRVATAIVVEFAAGICSALLMLTCFIGVLWQLSGSLDVGGVRVEGYMVWAALLYAIAGTGLTSLVGRPLENLAAAKLAAEGDYRAQLIRANENFEGIALMRGEADERRLLDVLFAALTERWIGLRRGTSRVAWLTTGYSLKGIVFPTLVASPMYLAGDMAAPEENRIVTRKADGDELRIAELDIAFPDGAPVITRASMTIKPGEKILIAGESGSGKSTLLRAVAGVWPWGRGTIEIPREARIMFMPQRPNFPIGTLGAALAYPLPSDAFPEEAYRAVLDRCNLASLVTRLREDDRWDQVLSGGEQQRLSFARVLLHQPGFVFVDEATSALDEANQADMMRLFRAELSTAAVVSIGHRSELAALHDRTMTLVRGDESARLVRGLRRSRAVRRHTGRLMSEQARRSILVRLRAIALRNWRRRDASE